MIKPVVDLAKDGILNREELLNAPLDKLDIKEVLKIAKWFGDTELELKIILNFGEIIE